LVIEKKSITMYGNMNVKLASHLFLLSATSVRSTASYSISLRSNVTYSSHQNRSMDTIYCVLTWGLPIFLLYLNLGETEWYAYGCTKAVFLNLARPRPGKIFFYKTRARSQQIYS